MPQPKGYLWGLERVWAECAADDDPLTLERFRLLAQVADNTVWAITDVNTAHPDKRLPATSDWETPLTFWMRFLPSGAHGRVATVGDVWALCAHVLADRTQRGLPAPHGGVALGGAAQIGVTLSEWLADPAAPPVFHFEDLVVGRLYTAQGDPRYVITPSWIFERPRAAAAEAEGSRAQIVDGITLRARLRARLGEDGVAH